MALKETDHLIWSDYYLDLEDWRESLEEEYPGYSDDELTDIMYKTNAVNIDDERYNLDILLKRTILVIGDLGLWNGRRMGYKEIESGNIKDCLFSDTDFTTWYVDKDGDLRCEAIHHDGTNYYRYRVYKADATEQPKKTSSPLPIDSVMKSAGCTDGSLPMKQRNLWRWEQDE